MGIGEVAMIGAATAATAVVMWRGVWSKQGASPGGRGSQQSGKRRRRATSQPPDPASVSHAGTLMLALFLRQRCRDPAYSGPGPHRF